MSFQAYLDNIKVQTGKTPEDFVELAKQKALLEPGVKAGQIVAWLKEDYGLGYGHAMAIVNVFRHATGPKVTGDERIAKLFSGPRAIWRESYDELMAELRQFGPDVRATATDTYVSLLRGEKKFGILQVTADRMDVGIKLKGSDATERLRLAGSWSVMVTHRVSVTAPKQLDEEVLAWLKRAYEATGTGMGRQ